MTEYPGTSLRTRILGRHYDLLFWDAIITRTLGRHYDLVSWDAIMTSISWDAIMTSYPGTPL